MLGRTSLCSILLLSISLHAEPPKTLSAELLQMHLAIPGTSDLKLKKHLVRTSAKRTTQNLIAEKGLSRLEVETQTARDEQSAIDEIHTRSSVIRNLYGPQQTPYQGAITNTSTCKETLKPIPKKMSIAGLDAEVLFANAGSRFDLGVCDPGLFKTRAAVALFFDTSSGTLFQISIYVKAEDLADKKLEGLLSGIMRR